MKRQFVQMKPSSGIDQQQQTPPSQQWSQEEESVHNTPEPQHNVSPLSQQPAPAGKGLLSTWKAQAATIAPAAPTMAVEKHRGSRQDFQNPVIEQNGNAQFGNFVQGPTSPHESGIGPLAHLLTAAPVQPVPPAMRPFTQPAQPSVVQPQSPPAPQYPSYPQSVPPPRQQQQAYYLPPAWATQAAPVRPQTQQPPHMQPPLLQYTPAKKRKQRFPMWARASVAVFLVLLILTGTAFGYYEANFAQTVSNTVGQRVTRLKGDDAPQQITNSGDILSGSRVNILLLGSDTDQKFTDASGVSHYIAQTDIVVTLDPQTKTVGMLSIPRDSWLYAPGYSTPMKLDEAYGYGGAALSEATIHQTFGIYINYYAWVGLDGFIKVINTAGGVDIDATHPITDDNYPDDVGNKTGDIYAYKRLSIAPGPQHLNGPQALEYVRSRHADLVGDFGRSMRQQQVLTQLKTKLNSPDIIAKLPEIAKDLNGYVKTDMQLQDVFKLMNFARSLDQNKIQRLTLGPPYSGSATVNGKDVVVLNCAKIQPLIATMFNLGDNSKCNVGTAQGANTTAVAAPVLPATPVVANSLQMATQLAQLNTLSLNGGDTSLFGLRALLDLMFTVVCESPAGMKV